MTKIDAFVDQHWKGIVGGLIAAVIAAEALLAQVNRLDERKADKVDVEQLRNDVRAILKTQEGTNRMLCRDPRNRNDSACPYVSP